MIILEIFLSILGTILFLLPGIFLSYILFPKCDIVERSVYSILLSSTLKLIYSSFLSATKIFSVPISTTIWIFLIVVFLLIIILNKKKYETTPNRHIIYIILLSIMGFAFKLWYLLPIKNITNCYDYASKFIRGSVPDLGFYTGMAVNHSYYILNKINDFISFISLNNHIQIFLSAFIYLGFIYILFNTYKKTIKITFLAVALLATFPIELFLNIDIGTLLISYISVISLFILFRKEEKGFYIFCFIICFELAIRYYTATMVVIVLSVGFIIALLIKHILKREKIKTLFKNLFCDKKLLAYFFILVMCSLILFTFTEMGYFTVKNALDVSDLKYAFNSLDNNQEYQNNTDPTILDTNKSLPEIYPLTEEYSIYNVVNPYQEKRFLGLSGIGWESLFFLLCGFSFIIYVFLYFIRKKPLEETDIDILYGIIPAAILGFAFLYMNYPARAFCYLSFFSILALKVPKRLFNYFSILAFIFIFLINIYVIDVKRIFLETSEGEINGAEQIKNNLSGKIFSDQCFVNQLVLHDYYYVTGTDDKSKILYGLFYSKNSIDFEKAISDLRKNGVSYIATTKRMRNEYILMLNFPQKPLTNMNFYEENLEKVYDNGDVIVYDITIPKTDQD